MTKEKFSPNELSEVEKENIKDIAKVAYSEILTKVSTYKAPNKQPIEIFQLIKERFNYWKTVGNLEKIFLLAHTEKEISQLKDMNPYDQIIIEAIKTAGIAITKEVENFEKSGHLVYQFLISEISRLFNTNENLVEFLKRLAPTRTQTDPELNSDEH